MPRILVVDDNAALAENLAEIITDTDLGDVVVADSGARALEVLRSEHIDLMLTDMRMPGMNGSELIREARKSDPTLPVIVMSAYTGEDDLSLAMQEGLLAVFGKPVPMKSLFEVLPHARRLRPILIVEDDVALAENVADVLRGRGLSTVTAHSLAQIDQVGGQPSLALVDLRIRGGADCASLEQVRLRFPKIAMVVMTAFRTEMEPIPAVEIVDKPFETSSLIALLERLSSDPPPTDEQPA
jgi:DNA-binding NtrC family response regulator